MDGQTAKDRETQDHSMHCANIASRGKNVKIELESLNYNLVKIV